MPASLIRAFAVLVLSIAPLAAAQVRPPPVPALPSTTGAAQALPAVPGTVNEAQRLLDTTSAALGRDLQERRPRLVRDLLRSQRERVEADPNGAPVLRGELLLTDPSPALIEAARAREFTLLRDETLDGLDLRVVVLRVPPGMPIAEALGRLRLLDAGVQADFHHLYQGSGAVEAGAATTRSGAAPATLPDVGAVATPAPPSEAARAPSLRIGLVDGGVDAQHPALRSSPLQRWGCDGAAQPQAHGTAVASLLVGRAAHFAGALPGAALWAADVYCNDAAGGSAATVARALAWMARERVPVVNLSLVGPPNNLLERVVRALLDRGHVLVAAVGNDGPATPPLYPAAYDGVVGVTAVGPDRRVLPEAGRGPHVAFAAPGAQLAVAGAGAGYATARGTSFAAPLAAGLLAGVLVAPEPAQARRAIEQLARTAIDLGAGGRDPVYGFGLVGESLRVEPRRVAASLHGPR